MTSGELSKLETPDATDTFQPIARPVPAGRPEEAPAFRRIIIKREE
jgi:hypothetical protein